ncbi:MAG: hypothetical protein AB1497_05535 [Bacillota bacterium]
MVLFTRAKWLRVEEFSMPVFESGMALAWHIRRQGKNTVLRPEQVEAIAGALIGAVLLSGQGTPSGTRDIAPEGAAANGNPCGCRTETGKTRNGRSYVKVYRKGRTPKRYTGTIKQRGKIRVRLSRIVRCMVLLLYGWDVGPESTRMKN